MAVRQAVMRQSDNKLSSLHLDHFSQARQTSQHASCASCYSTAPNCCHRSRCIVQRVAGGRVREGVLGILWQHQKPVKLRKCPCNHNSSHAGMVPMLVDELNLAWEQATWPTCDLGIGCSLLGLPLLLLLGQQLLPCCLSFHSLGCICCRSWCCDLQSASGF